MNRPRDRVSRRRLLAGGAGVLGLAALGAGGVASGLLPGGGGTGGGLPAGVPDVAPGRRVDGSFVSARRAGATVGWSISYPRGATFAAVPVLVVLHGRGGDHRGAFEAGLHLDRFQAAAAGEPGGSFAIASVDGGDHEYWHPRRRTDAAGMVVHEFLPLLAEQGWDVARIGLLGWSMGGYGALYLTSVLGRRRVACAVAESPAIWRHGYQSAAGAFDDAADFDRHAILGRQDRLRGVPLRIDCGVSDSFAPITRELRASISPTPAGGIEPGGHDDTYWRSQAPAQLGFVGQHLF